jgi:hypothetical protein
MNVESPANRRNEFHKLLRDTFDALFSQARNGDGLSFLFSILGIDSGAEDAGWQPVAETQALVADIVGLLQGPIYDDAKLRLALLLYCHVIEASYHYHCIYNLLLTIDGQTPKVFNFLDKYKNGVPPSFQKKISEIEGLAIKHNQRGVLVVFEKTIRTDIRNAFFHSDYIIYNGELRLKHKGSEIAKIPHEEVYEITQNALDFFNFFLSALEAARKSFPPGHVIKNRKSERGPLCSITVLFDPEGRASGFTTSDPLPLW